ncbi:hypothetical protein ACFE04_025398 [Oxalis oulophora]
MSETLSKSPQHPSHQNLPLVGRRLPLYEDHTTLNDEPCASRREDRVKPSPYPPEWNSYLLRLVEKGLTPRACHTRRERSAEQRPITFEELIECKEVPHVTRGGAANLSIWGLLMAYKIINEPSVINQVHVPADTRPERLAQIVTYMKEAKAITFTDRDLPPEGSNHVKPLNEHHR